MRQFPVKALERLLVMFVSGPFDWAGLSASSIPRQTVFGVDALRGQILGCTGSPSRRSFCGDPRPFTGRRVEGCGHVTPFSEKQRDLSDSLL